MKQYLCLAAIALLQLGGPLFSMTLIPANHPFIQYVGRWDLTDSLHPKHSWPGVYIIVSFTGSSIGIRSNDATNYYNVYIDGTLHRVFHGEKQGDADYILADSLGKGEHTLMLSKRNISFDEIFTVSGFLLDDGARLLPPPPLPARRIEFVGDSFTAAESNEATAQSLPWVERFPVTNIDKGFGPVIARHYGAQYHTTCRSGGGMYCDWQGIRDLTLPERFNRTLMERDTPKWDFKQWVPDLVMVCLGLNDYSGLKGKDATTFTTPSSMSSREGTWRTDTRRSKPTARLPARSLRLSTQPESFRKPFPGSGFWGDAGARHTHPHGVRRSAEGRAAALLAYCRLAGIRPHSGNQYTCSVFEQTHGAS